jgi:predicted negative regulator of RcsB-dependent stress response
VEAYTTEEQQVEAIKKWFKQNGLSTFLTIAIGFALVFGWQFWTSHMEEKQQAASVIYQDMIEALALVKNPAEAEKQASTVRHLGGQLIDEYSDLHYARFAALAIAKLEVEKGDLDAAAERLQWVAGKEKGKSLGNVAKVRLARVLSAQQKYDEALAVLSDPLDSSIRILAEEVKGDIYTRAGKAADARMAYQTSIDLANSVGAQMDGLLQMKLNDLAVASD